MSDQSAIKGIVDSVQAQEATLIDAASRSLYSDNPTLPITAGRHRPRRGHRREPEVGVVSLLPVAPWPVLLVLVVAGARGRLVEPLVALRAGGVASTHWRLTAAVVLLGLRRSARPCPGSRSTPRPPTSTSTSSSTRRAASSRRTTGTSGPRVEGVASDISAIAAALPGARYSVVTFDQAARVRLPLTTDTTALDAAVETLLPESYEVSRGTSVSEANDRLKTLLQQADARTPERGRIVFYLGDGEQTAADPPAPFDIDKRLINGGAVLGYGTTEGGRMKATRSRFDTSRNYIKDPATGEDARSVVSEATLRTIGDQLGLAYVHREAGDAIGPAVDGIDLERFGTSEQIEKQKVHRPPRAVLAPAHRGRRHRGLGGGRRASPRSSRPADGGRPAHDAARRQAGRRGRRTDGGRTPSGLRGLRRRDRRHPAAPPAPPPPAPAARLRPVVVLLVLVAAAAALAQPRARPDARRLRGG